MERQKTPLISRIARGFAFTILAVVVAVLGYYLLFGQDKVVEVVRMEYIPLSDKALSPVSIKGDPVVEARDTNPEFTHYQIVFMDEKGEEYTQTEMEWEDWVQFRLRDSFIINIDFTGWVWNPRRVK